MSQGTVDVLYEYKPIDGSLTQIKNKIDGIHNVDLRIKTPFELLEYGEVIVVTQVQNYVFETTVNVVTDHTNISLLGNLQVIRKAIPRQRLHLSLSYVINSTRFTVRSTLKISSIWTRLSTCRQITWWCQDSNFRFYVISVNSKNESALHWENPHQRVM